MRVAGEGEISALLKDLKARAASARIQYRFADGAVYRKTLGGTWTKDKKKAFPVTV